MIGIDTSVLLYKYARTYKDDWLTGFKNIIEVLHQNKVNPIFVMDG
jgi:hypothetical protein